MNAEHNNYNQRPMKLSFEKDGFTDQNGNLREELITTEALEIAKCFKRDGLTKSQLRAFFNEVKGIKNRLQGNEEKFDSIYPLIVLMKSKMAYRASKGSEKEQKQMANFKLFFMVAISRIQADYKNNEGCQSFKNFAIFFEAVVAYCYGEHLRD